MIEKTRWGKPYLVRPRQRTPNREEPTGKCEKCGRKRHKCGVSDCVRHFHNVVVR